MIGTAMPNTETTSVDSGAYPATAVHMTAALNAALEAGDLDLILGALGEMARAHRMRRVAQETGLGRESLYKSMRGGSSPEFSTVLKVLRALGFRLQVSPFAGSTDGQSAHQHETRARRSS